MSTDPTNGAHALFMANCAKREAELARNPNGGNWYWEGDGERHAMRYYVLHDCKAGRIDCKDKRTAKALAKKLNAEKAHFSVFPE